MAGCRGRENAVLANQELFDTVRSADAGDQLDNLGVPVAAVATNNKEGAYRERNRVVRFFVIK